MNEKNWSATASPLIPKYARRIALLAACVLMSLTARAQDIWTGPATGGE